MRRYVAMTSVRWAKAPPKESRGQCQLNGRLIYSFRRSCLGEKCGRWETSGEKKKEEVRGEETKRKEAKK